MIKNRVFALIFRTSAFAVVLINILFDIGVLGADVIKPTQPLYYTVQSNILVMILFGLLACKTAIGLRKEGRTGSCGYLPQISAGALLMTI